MASVFALLPGGDLVEQGISDLREDLPTVEAALVLMAATRLRRLGLEVVDPGLASPAGHELYARLSERHPATAYSQYNALTRRLASFLRAAG